MPNYHVGSLDESAKSILALGEAREVSDVPRPTFLDSRNWTKAILHTKATVSWDTRIFTYKLEHDEQRLGLPTGQHLMIRLRDPVTREAIIRSYTPISHETKAGYLDVLVKVYFDTKERKGGKMSQAMDSLPIGHSIEFKGPIGKFEYLGHGRCTVNGKERKVSTFVMICGGSGITPIFQVLRRVLEDKDDPTQCILLDGNRLIEDILCKDDLDTFALAHQDRCKLMYTLTAAPTDWEGLKGRIAGPLLREHAPWKEDSMALICGPEALEKSAHQALNEQGWDDEHLLFF